jgi:hypothetical protein
MEERVRQQRETQHVEYHFEDRSDNTCLSYQQRSNEKQWIHGPQPAREQAKAWIDEASLSNAQTVIVWKAGLGYVPKLLHEMNPNLRMIICENRLELVWESLCCWDCQYLFENGSRLLVFEDDLLSAVQKLIQQYPVLFPADTKVIPGSVLDEEDQRYLKTIDDCIQTASIQTNQYTKTKTICIMSRSPENIFTAVSREIQSIGYTPIIAKRSSALSGLLKNHIAWKETCGGVPEIAVAFYSSIFHAQELDDMKQQGVKRVCWLYDRMYDLPESLGEQYDLALTFDRKHVEYLQPIFGDRARYLPAATGMEHVQHPPQILPPTPVTFVGATGLRRSLSYINQNRAVSMQLLQIINRVIGSGWDLHRC